MIVGLNVLLVFVGNVVVNVICSLWVFVVIFNGYFIEDVENFEMDNIDNEIWVEWYLC